MQIRNFFPFFQNNPDIIYLDSAATSQKPQIVIDEVTKYLTKTANPGRSNFGLSLQTQDLIENIREKVATFFGAKTENLAFTTGVTDGINSIVQSLAKNILETDDEILICLQDHKATILPWLNLVKKLEKTGKKIHIKNYGLDPFSGLIDIKKLQNQVTQKTKFVILTHSHNVLGAINPISQITKILPKNIVTVLDMAQTAGHIPVNFENLNVDLAVFSGHKMFSLEGVGGLFASHKIRNNFEQIKFGGGTESQTFPDILEIGTKNTVSIISLGTAVDFIQNIGIANIQKQTEFLTQELLEKLKKFDNIEFMSGVAFNSKLENTGIISFKPSFEIEKLEFLSQENHINLRIGKHCTQELPDSVRVGLHAYNNLEDIDFLIKTIKYVKNLSY
jgi:cysteine desulfurase / selenocysteine lyase